MYSVAIIGCGSIGADREDDVDYPYTTEALTHAHAFYDRGFQIHFVDPNVEKTNKAMKKFNINSHVMLEMGMKAFEIQEDTKLILMPKSNTAWNSPKDFFREIKEIDVAVISAPTELHKELAIDVLNCNPKIVIIEKPFGRDLEEAKTIAELYERAKVPLLVNFTRRYIPEFWQLKDELERQKIYWATIKYTRGLIREACHALDLCNLLFGWCHTGYLLEMPEESLIYDYSKDDPTYAARLEYSKCPIVMLLPSDGRNFGIFEMEICTNEGIYEILHNGEIIRKRGLEVSTYGHYNTISPYKNTEQIVPLKNALPHLVSEVCAYLDEENTEFSCTAQHAIEVHQIYDRLFEVSPWEE